MERNTYISTIKSKKINKQNRSGVIDTENILMLSRWKGMGEWAKKVKGLGSTNWQLQNSHGDIKYSIRNSWPKNIYA